MHLVIHDSHIWSHSVMDDRHFGLHYINQLKKKKKKLPMVVNKYFSRGEMLVCFLVNIKQDKLLSNSFKCWIDISKRVSYRYHTHFQHYLN